MHSCRGMRGDDDCSGAYCGVMRKIERAALDFQAGVIAVQGRGLGNKAGGNPDAAGFDAIGIFSSERSPQRYQKSGRATALEKHLDQPGWKKEVKPDLHAVFVQEGAKGLGGSRSRTPLWNRVAQQVAAEAGLTPKHQRSRSTHGGLASNRRR